MNSTVVISQLDTDYTPEEFNAVAGYVLSQRNRVAEPVEEKPKPTPEPEEPKAETIEVETFVPWDFRFNSWLLTHFGLGSRDGSSDMRGNRLWLPRKLLVWAILAHPRLRRMLWVLRSGKAEDDIFAERSDICNKCPNMKIGKDGEAYCGSCRCPDWHYSILRIKNRFRANHCPELRHPGTYIKLVTHTWPNRKKVEPKRPDSIGCGGNGHG